MAKELDPLDPTPYFYDAIRKQTINRPVEALHDLQKSVELNDNRAIYRSKELLDDDLAARSASLSRVYSDLGFEQLALVEGWNSVNTDPSNYSAHRLLADSYTALPRYEIARVSELLQSQLLQPSNITPVQPQLAESDLLILNGAGPGELSYNEYNPLFNRNRLVLQLSGVAGGNDTFGDELVLSGIHNNISFSFGQYHYETEGFRKNNDLSKNLYNVFTQVNITNRTSIQAEFRKTKTKNGDLPLRFLDDGFSTSLRQEEESDSLRLGFRHFHTPNSTFIVSLIYGEEDISSKLGESFVFPLPPPPIGPGPVNVNLDTEILFDNENQYLAEVQYLFKSNKLNLQAGAGYYTGDRDDIKNISYSPELPPFLMSSFSQERGEDEHMNLYLYTTINALEKLNLILGASFDSLKNDFLDLERDQFNPKFGLTWTPLPDTTVRTAVFRTINREYITKQTIEPTQLAGFNQFFDDTAATESWLYGAGIDQKISSKIFTGVEFFRRDIDIPFLDSVAMKTGEADWEENVGRAYVYLTPVNWMALHAEYQYEMFEGDPAGGVESTEIETHRAPLGIRLFHYCGLGAQLKATYIDQQGEFLDSTGKFTHGEDQFWVVDALISYRLPKRYGVISLEAKNLFDEEFNYQDTDPSNPKYYPEQLLLARFTLAY
jgi:hypothetical protein